MMDDQPQAGPLDPTLVTEPAGKKPTRAQQPIAFVEGSTPQLSAESDLHGVVLETGLLTQ